MTQWLEENPSQQAWRARVHAARLRHHARPDRAVLRRSHPVREDVDARRRVPGGGSATLRRRGTRTRTAAAVRGRARRGVWDLRHRPAASRAVGASSRCRRASCSVTSTPARSSPWARTSSGSASAITSRALAIPACGRCPQCLEGDPQWCTGDEKLMGSARTPSTLAIAEAQAVKVPAGLSWADGAIIEPVAVGLHGVQARAARSRRPGARDRCRTDRTRSGVLGAAHGCGQGRRHGEQRPSPEFADRAGATSFLVAGDNPVAEAIEALGGEPDVVIEAAGAPGTIEQAMQTVKPTGTVVVLGWCTVPDSYVPAVYLMKQVRLQILDDLRRRRVPPRDRHARRRRDCAPLDGERRRSRSTSCPRCSSRSAARRTQCKVLIDPRAAMSRDDSRRRAADAPHGPTSARGCKDAGELVFRETAPATPLDRATGFRVPRSVRRRRRCTRSSSSTIPSTRSSGSADSDAQELRRQPRLHVSRGADRRRRTRTGSSGNRGTVKWVSFLASPAALNNDDLEVEWDGSFEVWLGPEEMPEELDPVPARRRRK